MNNTIPSVVSAAQLLERIASSGGGLAQSALAAELGISASTCYRILQSLASRGWVRKDRAGAWSLDTGLLPVAAALRERAAWLDSARAVLARLASERGVSCKLSFRRGIEQVVAIRAERPSEVLTSGVEGVSYPVAEGSSGAALLADVPEPEALALLKAAPETETSARFLRDALADLRAKGWCGRRRIAGWPVSAISAPVRDSAGAVVAALTFIVPDTSFGDAAPVRLLLSTARSCGGARVPDRNT
ncbi:MAG: helix-turn-helix domain-containing protein [Kiritimatiellae bacterium]|nr:helix-turn-helix domain-containing protein [Kiritimatiellia bacterium]